MNIRKFESTIEFTNSGNLSFFFIGTGNAFSKLNFQTNLLIIKGKTHILVDCGTLCNYALQIQYNTKLSEINTLFITHPHADHIGGVEELAQVGMYVKKQKINLIANNRMKKTVWNQSLKGGLCWNENGRNTFDSYFNQIKPEKIKSNPFEMYEIDVEGINLKLFRTRHVTSVKNSFKNSLYSFGLIVDNHVLFTADTQFWPEQLNWILDNYKIDYIFHDCDMSGYSESVHASYKQLCTLPEKIRAKTYLCHYKYDSDESLSSIEKQVSSDGFAGIAKSGCYYDF